MGGGVAGLAAGWVTKFPVFEAADIPGGICASYYIRPKTTGRLEEAPKDGESYRFERGGGHWIFGAGDGALKFIHKFAATKNYVRKSAVYFERNNLYVSYPIQNNIRFLDKGIAKKALQEMRGNPENKEHVVMKDWLEGKFGRTLCELFFWPFNKLYTAGLYGDIISQDAHKTPVTHRKRKASGYNAIFLYPEGGLNCLAQDIAKVCDIHYAKRAVSIDTRRREICFADKTLVRYGTLISSVPLNCVIEMAGLKTTQVPDPYTSMLVLNIGATKGKRCPKKHWLYIPDSGSGFFRIGFYSNVNTSFLPRSSRRSNDRVSIYVERAFKGGMKPSKHEIEMYSRTVIRELQDRDFIKEAEVVDPSWVDVAYTWSWPGSTWREEALRMLSNNRIYQIGRYGRWKFQGIADSIIDGLNCVESVKR